MLRLSAAVVLGVVLLLGLPGCFFAIGTGTAPWKEEPAVTVHPDPVIDGDWSEPVNGIRMAVREVRLPGGEEPGVTLLVLAHNVSGADVPWMTTNPEQEVRSYGAQPDTLNGWVNDNLRIYASPVDRQHAFEGTDRLRSVHGGMLQPHAILRAGDIHILAIRLMPRAHNMPVQMSDNSVYSWSVDWPDMAEATGRWRLDLVYRPDGFPLPGDEGPVSGRDERVPGWAGKQIELPPIVINLDDEWE